MQLKFAGLGGSLRPNSVSARALQVALGILRERGHATSELLLSDLRLPGYGTATSLEDYPEGVRRLLREVRDAHGLIFSTPVYHGTVSGEVKNALDYLEFLAGGPSPYLTGKIVGLISTSGGTPGINAINTLDYVSRALHAWVCPTTVAIADSYQQFQPDGTLKNPAILSRLRRLADELEFAATRFQ